jgi:heme-degrading monooxygenase HmoA
MRPIPLPRSTPGQRPADASTPVDDPGAGVIVIDTFAVWRPLLGPVSSFNIRNGEAFNRSPGCISTTVLRGVGVGSIATYARWRSVADFAAAFSTATGKPAQSADDVNRAAARMTFGFIRPDHHSYELVIAKDRKP